MLQQSVHTQMLQITVHSSSSTQQYYDYSHLYFYFLLLLLLHWGRLYITGTFHLYITECAFSPKDFLASIIIKNSHKILAPVAT